MVAGIYPSPQIFLETANTFNAIDSMSINDITMAHCLFAGPSHAGKEHQFKLQRRQPRAAEAGAVVAAAKES